MAAKRTAQRNASPAPAATKRAAEASENTPTAENVVLTTETVAIKKEVVATIVDSKAENQAKVIDAAPSKRMSRSKLAAIVGMATLLVVLASVIAAFYTGHLSVPQVPEAAKEAVNQVLDQLPKFRLSRKSILGACAGAGTVVVVVAGGVFAKRRFAARRAAKAEKAA